MTDALDVTWVASYERADVERFAEEVELQRRRLEAAIAEARARVNDRAERGVEARRQLGDLVLAAQHEMDQVEAEYAELIDTIRAGAEAEAIRLLAAAHSEVDAMKQAAKTLAVRSPVPAVDVAEPHAE